MQTTPVITDGPTLRACRDALSVTREELAVSAGVSGSTVARIERGDVRPTRGTLRLLNLALAAARESR